MLIEKLLKWKGVPTNHELIENLPKERVTEYSQEAKYIKNTEYYQWMMQDLELMAERWMFRGDKDSLLIGKGILYCLQILNENVRVMAKGKVQQDSLEKKKMRRFR